MNSLLLYNTWEFKHIGWKGTTKGFFERNVAVHNNLIHVIIPWKQEIAGRILEVETVKKHRGS